MRVLLLKIFKIGVCECKRAGKSVCVFMLVKRQKKGVAV